MRRYVMITAFNKRTNNPTREHHHPLYHPLNILPNSAIDGCQNFDSTEEKWWLVPDKDSSYVMKKPGDAVVDGDVISAEEAKAE